MRNRVSLRNLCHITNILVETRFLSLVARERSLCIINYRQLTSNIIVHHLLWTLPKS